MAGFSLLDSTSATFDFQTDTTATDLTAANATGGVIPAATSANMNSWKCEANRCSVDINRQLQQRTTFCGNGWEGNFSGLKSLTGMLDGFESKGAPISDPMYMFSTNKGIPWIATIDTGLTLQANIMATNRHVGTIAAQNTEMGLRFTADGTYILPSSSWIVA